MKTFDCGITAVFKVTNVCSRSDRNLVVYENRYYGYLEDILECDFNSFKVVLLRSNGTGYEWMNVILKELLLSMPMDLP